MPDFYAVLEIDRTADEAAVKKAFRAMAMKHHPDRHGGDQGAAARFKAVAEAYRTLGDSQKRAAYDRTHAAQGPVVPPAARAPQSSASFDLATASGLSAYLHHHNVLGGLSMPTAITPVLAALKKNKTLVSAETVWLLVGAANRWHPALCKALVATQESIALTGKTMDEMVRQGVDPSDAFIQNAGAAVTPDVLDAYLVKVEEMRRFLSSDVGKAVVAALKANPALYLNNEHIARHVVSMGNRGALGMLKQIVSTPAHIAVTQAIMLDMIGQGYPPTGPFIGFAAAAVTPAILNGYIRSHESVERVACASVGNVVSGVLTKHPELVCAETQPLLLALSRYHSGLAPYLPSIARVPAP